MFSDYNHFQKVLASYFTIKYAHFMRVKQDEKEATFKYQNFLLAIKMSNVKISAKVIRNWNFFSKAEIIQHLKALKMQTKIM